MAKKAWITVVPNYGGEFAAIRLSIDEARNRLGAALQKLFANDALVLSLDLNEETIGHKITEYLGDQFPDLHTDYEYNGFEDTHPKMLLFLKNNRVSENEVYPDVTVHWRRKRVNVLVMEIKKMTNPRIKTRREDHLKLEAFTDPALPAHMRFHYHVGAFVDIAAGGFVKKYRRLFATVTWYVNGNRIGSETFVGPAYDGP